MFAQNSKAVVEALIAKLGQGASPETIAESFSESVDWYIAGDVALVPWIGRKIGRAGVAEFYRQIREQIIPERFVVSDILSSDNRVVVLGDLASRVKSTGKLIETAFALDLTVQDGLITRYHMLEDSYAVAQALLADTV